MSAARKLPSVRTEGSSNSHMLPSESSTRPRVASKTTSTLTVVSLKSIPISPSSRSPAALTNNPNNVNVNVVVVVGG